MTNAKIGAAAYCTNFHIGHPYNAYHLYIVNIVRNLVVQSVICWSVFTKKRQKPPARLDLKTNKVWPKKNVLSIKSSRTICNINSLAMARLVEHEAFNRVNLPPSRAISTLDGDDKQRNIKPPCWCYAESLNNSRWNPPPPPSE